MAEAVDATRYVGGFVEGEKPPWPHRALVKKAIVGVAPRKTVAVATYANMGVLTADPSGERWTPDLEASWLRNASEMRAMERGRVLA